VVSVTNPYGRIVGFVENTTASSTVQFEFNLPPRHSVAQVIDDPCYKPEDYGFESR
jgi:hypothetical protein